MKRRAFVKMAASGAAAWYAGSTLWGAANPQPGANDRLRVAVLGIHGHGFARLREFSSLLGVEVLRQGGLGKVYLAKGLS